MCSQDALVGFATRFCQVANFTELGYITPPIFHTNLKAWSVWALHALTFKRHIFLHLLLLHFSSRLFAAPLETSPFNRSAGTIKAKVLCI